MDNLSTHTTGALHEALPAPEAHRVLQRLEFHYTPKHASWLNMVEIEIGVLRGQCLDRRIGERDVLVSEIDAWQRQRNSARPARGSSGSSPRKRRGLSWHAPIRTPPKSRNHCAEVLEGHCCTPRGAPCLPQPRIVRLAEDGLPSGQQPTEAADYANWPLKSLHNLATSKLWVGGSSPPRRAIISITWMAVRPVGYPLQPHCNLVRQCRRTQTDPRSSRKEAVVTSSMRRGTPIGAR